MAMFEDAFKGSGLWVGLGLAVAAPVILPIVGAVARPLAKTAIKGYLAAADTLVPLASMATTYVGDVLSGFREEVSSVVAEAQDEYQSKAAGASDSAAQESSEAKPQKPRRMKEAKVEQPAGPDA